MVKRVKRRAERVAVTCPCGKKFTVTRNRYESGRGRRCSKECQYRFMQRPSGLKYKTTKENPGAFKPGNRPWNAGTAGMGLTTPWNKGVPSGVVPLSAFKPGDGAREANPKWRGDQVSYNALHAWVARNKPKTGACQQCGKEGATEWSNVSHEYRRDLEDFREFCHQCNAIYDVRSGGWGAAKKIFPTYGSRRN